MIKIAGENVWPKADGDIAYASDFNRIEHLTATATSDTVDATTSSSYSDTSLTVTLSGLTSTETYTFLAFVTSRGNADGDSLITKLIIDNTDVCEIDMNFSTSQGIPLSLHGIVTGQTGLTSVTAKVQFKNDNNSTSVSLGMLTNSRITIIAFPE